MLWAVIAGIFFAISYVTVRAVYLEESFSTGFVFARLGSFLAALPLLAVPSVYKSIFNRTKKQEKQAKGGYLLLAVNKGLAAFYFLGMNFAISLASATLVNALAGLQFALLFVVVFVSSKLVPKFFNEYFTRTEIIQQIIAMLFIIGGLAFMVF